MDLRLLRCLFYTISHFIQNVCLCGTEILWQRWRKKLVDGIAWYFTFNSILTHLVLIVFKCISLKRFHCCSKFSISVTQRYKTKLHAIVPNADYFKPIILKFKTFIYNSDSKFMYNLLLPYRWGGIPTPLPPGGGDFLTLVFLERTPQNM